jgi:predicted nucleic acid-binding protein
MFNFPFADDAPQYRDDTRRLFAEIKAGKFEPYTSEYVLDELNSASESKRLMMFKLIAENDIQVLSKNDETGNLAAVYVQEGIIPAKFSTDSLHIASATVNDMDFIVSLNFQHIVKRKTIEETELINYREGYKKIGIYTPAEVIDYDTE